MKLVSPSLFSEQLDSCSAIPIRTKAARSTEHRFLLGPDTRAGTGRAALAPVCTPLTVSESGGRKPSPFLPEPIAAVGVGNHSEKV